MCFRVKEYPGTITNALFSVEKVPLACCLDALREATFRKKTLFNKRKLNYIEGGGVQI